MLDKINTRSVAVIAAFCLVAGYAARPFLDADAASSTSDPTNYKMALSNGPIYGAKGSKCQASQIIPALGADQDFTVTSGEAVSEKRLLDLFNLNFNTQYHEKIVYADLNTGKIYSSLAAGVQHVLNQGHSLVFAHATDFPNFAECSVSGGAMPVDVVVRLENGTYVSEKTPLLGELLSKHGETVYMVDLAQGESGAVVEMDIEQAVSKIISVQIYNVEVPPFFHTEAEAQSFLKGYNEEDGGVRIQRAPYIPRTIEPGNIQQRNIV